MLNLQKFTENLNKSNYTIDKDALKKYVPYSVLSYDLNEKILPAFEYLFNPTYYSVREIYMFGSRKSAKTKHVALRLIYRLLTDEEYNALAMRKIAGEIMDSIKEEIQWAIRELGVSHLFKFTAGAKTFTFTPTGQKIVMKGIAINPSSGKPSLSGLNITQGRIKDVWLEEAWEFILADYTMIRGTIRGGSYTLLITGNPYYEFIWCVRQAAELLRPELNKLIEDGQQWAYFAKKTGLLETIVHWNNFQINGFLSEEDREERWAEEKRNPKDFTTTGYGMVGSPSGTILGDLTHKIKFITMDVFVNRLVSPEGGVDVGLTNDATAAVFGGMLDDGTDAYAGEYYHGNGDQEANQFSNDGVWRKKDPDELALDVLEFFLLYKSIWEKFGIFKVAVDSADRSFIKTLNNKALVYEESQNIKFVPTIGEEEGKKHIETRIIEWRQEMSHRKTAFVMIDEMNTMERLLYEMNNLPWKINQSNGKAQAIRDDSKVPDHITNAAEYKKRRNQTKRLRQLGL